MKQHSIDVEVRYYETDGQGIVHHANYFQYFELARVQMLKAAGYDYADLERDGFLLVVHKIGCRFLLPAKFGDTLKIVTTIERATAARIDHSYKVYRDDILLAEAESTLACVSRDGQIQRMPNMLYEDPTQELAT
jgi:acyl-CoA thioester hydrolase